MLTAYDFAMAQLVDEAGVDAILVGDSLSNDMEPAACLGLPRPRRAPATPSGGGASAA